MSFREWIILHTSGQSWYNYFIPPTGFTVSQENSIKPFTDIQIDGRPGGREAQANIEVTDGERLP